MNSRDLAHFERMLRKRLTDLDTEDALGQSAQGKVVLDQQSVGRLTRMDALQQQAMANATRTRRQQERQRISAALQRVADETYGQCLDCGDDIVAARLDLDPTAALCISCARG